ncbi:NUDIX hydrolase domain-like protein [Xylariaceae sp. FL0016]|nr:NUDIX hydrolase domain-like protein [Xylariaceae sp. FL0016]
MSAQIPSAAGLLIWRVRLDETPEVLVLLRSRASSNPNTWSLPGGSREHGETTTQTAIRETLEKVGISARSLGLSAQYTANCGSWSYTTILARQVGPITVNLNDKHTDFRWATLQMLEGGSVTPLYPRFQDVLPDLRRLLEAQDRAAQADFDAVAAADRAEGGVSSTRTVAEDDYRYAVAQKTIDRFHTEGAKLLQLPDGLCTQTGLENPIQEAAGHIYKGEPTDDQMVFIARYLDNACRNQDVETRRLQAEVEARRGEAENVASRVRRLADRRARTTAEAGQAQAGGPVEEGEARSRAAYEASVAATNTLLNKYASQLQVFRRRRGDSDKQH